MCIEVLEVPKRLPNKSGQGAKITPEIDNEKKECLDKSANQFNNNH